MNFSSYLLATCFVNGKFQRPKEEFI